MSDQETADRSSTQESETQSLAELFHLVKTLIPDDQRVLTVPPNMTVAEAVQKMQEHNYSQLPVVAGNQVLRLFSFRSLALRLLRMGNATYPVSGLRVGDFMEDIEYVQLSDQWEKTLGLLNRDNAVLVGQREALRGILTPMDVLNYLHKITSPFVMLAEIELSLRRIIKACVSDKDLKACVQNALTSKYGPPSEPPTELSEMEFNDYAQIITNKLNWAHFAGVFFGEGERADWARKDVNDRLTQVRELRNDVFHFKRSLSEEDLQALREHRDWLQIRTRAFEATRAAPPTRGKPPISQRGKWDEPSFFAKLEAERGSQAADVAKHILAWARQKGTRVGWGTGKLYGSFTAVVSYRGKDHHPFSVWTNSTLGVNFGYLKYRPPFDSEAKRLELLHKLNGVEGISLSDDAITRYPSIPLDILKDQAALQQLLGIFEWVIEEIRKT